MDRNRLPWLILAIALMVASAICGLLYMDAVARISGWTGLPKYEAYVPNLQESAVLWSGLAVIFPFLAALLLGVGKEMRPRLAETNRTDVISCPEVSHEWAAVTAILAYLRRVGISAVASLGFMIAYVLLVFLLSKLGIRPH